MENLFFVDGSVAGRCGPDKQMWDLEELKRNNIVAILSVNDGEMVHCRSGKDRTGLALAAYLMQSKGYEVNQAIATIKSVRDIAFTAPKWGELSVAVLTALKTPNKSVENGG